MENPTAPEALIPFSGDDWLDPLEEAVRCQRDYALAAQSELVLFSG